MRGQVRNTESFDHHLEERGRDSEVVRRALPRALLIAVNVFGSS